MMPNVDALRTPHEHEAERASNSYLMSLVALLSGVVLPVVNLIATLIFFLGNRRATYFVRWHCTQALVSQVAIFLLNAPLFWWTISILFLNASFSSEYVAYLLLILMLNFVEMVSTIWAAIQTRKGAHVEWLFFGELTHLLCRPKP